MMTMANDYGRFNPEDDESSLWYGYLSLQRTLCKIECGFTHQTLAASGIWINTEYPTSPTVFVGVIQGDMSVSDANEVALTIKPLTQIFRDFAATNITGLTSTGLTAKQFLTLVRDQTDGSSNFIFRPFFQDTTTYWNITSTGFVYAELNTSGAKSVYDKNLYDVIEKLAEAEALVPYVSRDGTFNFKGRDPNTTTAAFEFFGRGFLDTDYGQTIKKVSKYGKKISNYYSRVEVRWLETNTITAVRVRESTLTVSPNSAAWKYGQRTYKAENLWIATSTAADTLANTIFSEVSSLKDEIDFTTSLVPHLELLDRVKVSYETTEKATQSRWDVSDWAADDTSTSTDLVWAVSSGDAIRFVDKEFKLVSIDIDLENFETKFTGIAI
jgi:hypothetical protein